MVHTNKRAGNVYRKGLVFLESICLGDAFQVELFLTGQSKVLEVFHYQSLIPCLAKVSFTFGSRVFGARENLSDLRGFQAPY